MADRTAQNAYVLIVEDEEANLDLLTRTLRSDAKLWTARTILEAHKTLAENEVSVIVADHRLPDGTGVSLLTSVAERFPKIGRVLVTGYGDSEDVVQACAQGIVQRFFLKPYSPQQLRGGVLGLLRRHGALGLPRVLLADDDEAIRRALSTILKSKFIDVTAVADGEQAIQASEQAQFDVALIDLMMPKRDGVTVLRHLLAKDPDMPIIVLTAVDLSVGLTLLEAGAFDVISKPVRQDELAMRIERAIIARRQQDQHKKLLSEIKASRQREDLVAESSSMKAVVDQARMVGKHDVSVLVVGETGTGKEVIARMIHRESRRAGGPFIPVNCGAIPDSLIENELFGHERGAYTDAKAAKPGFFESADGGTIFLDEVGELSLSAQVRLLRVLETHEVQRVGSTRLTRIDTRVIAATHQDLEQLVNTGRFRRDLLYRLNGFTIQIPPLRSRPEDIGPLVEMAATNFCSRNGLGLPEISSEALAAARRHRWPGNVRELLHRVERALITRGPTRIDDLELERAPGAEAFRLPTVDDSLPLKDVLQPVVDELEKAYLTRILEKFGGHLGRTADHAGIHRKSLYNKLRRLGLASTQTRGPAKRSDPRHTPA